MTAQSCSMPPPPHLKFQTLAWAASDTSALPGPPGPPGGGLKHSQPSEPHPTRALPRHGHSSQHSRQSGGLHGLAPGAQPEQALPPRAPPGTDPAGGIGITQDLVQTLRPYSRLPLSSSSSSLPPPPQHRSLHCPPVFGLSTHQSFFPVGALSQTTCWEVLESAPGH